MKKSIIDTSTNEVVQAVELDTGANWLPPDEHIIGPDGGNIGDAYDPATQTYTPPPVPEPTPSEAAFRRIKQLEASVTPRRMREAVLTNAGAGWLQDVEDQIAAELARL